MTLVVRDCPPPDWPPPPPDWPPSLWAAAIRCAKVRNLADRLVARGESVCSHQVIFRLATLENAAAHRFAQAFVTLSPSEKKMLSAILNPTTEAER